MEDDTDARESFLTAASISSQRWPFWANNILSFNCKLVSLSIRLASIKLLFSPVLTICNCELLSPVRSNALKSGELKSISWIVSKPIAGVSSILDSVLDGPQLGFNFLDCNHFSNLEHTAGIGPSSVVLPMVHVPTFFGEGLSSNNSKASTSWKYNFSLSKFGGLTNFPYTYQTDK